MSNPTVEPWAIEKLIPHTKNAKKHSPAQVDALAALIRELGWTQPIVVDKDGVIIAGHGRRLAAINLGMKVVPVICRRDLSKVEADAMRLADNRVASTEYDQALIQEEIARLDLEGFNIGLMGFSERELDFLTADLGEIPTDLGAFVEDVGEAVEEQKAENADKVAAVEGSDVPVSEALGFKRVSVPVSRRLKALMALLEEETGRKGIEALLAHAEELGA